MKRSSERGATLVSYALTGAMVLFILLHGISYLKNQIIAVDSSLAADAALGYGVRISKSHHVDAASSKP